MADIIEINLEKILAKKYEVAGEYMQRSRD